MTWWGWVLGAAVLALLGIVVVLARMTRHLAQSVHELSAGLDGLRQQTLPLLADTRSALRRAEGVNRRADALIDTATSITGTVDAATRLAYSVVSNPLVRVLSFFTGTRRTAKRLRGATSPSGTLSRATQVPRQIQQARRVAPGPDAAPDAASRRPGKRRRTS